MKPFDSAIQKTFVTPQARLQIGRTNPPKYQGIPGLEVQEVELHQPSQCLMMIRQRMEQWPQAGGKTLLEVSGYCFQAPLINRPRSVHPDCGRN